MGFLVDAEEMLFSAMKLPDYDGNCVTVFPIG
jgi:hypothetical protein